MASLQNTETQYGTVAMVLHWLIALAILLNVGLGLYMGDLPRGSQAQAYYIQLHKSIGITILLLSVLRLGWRLINPVPPLPDGLKPWERLGARAIHYAFYVLIIAIPLSGWAIISASPLNVPTYLYGIVYLPHLPFFATIENKKAAAEAIAEVHQILAWATMALLALHVAAALKHHFVLKDDVLRRMLP